MRPHTPKSPAAALGLILLLAVLAFGATEQWARSAVQAAAFCLGLWCFLLRLMPVRLAVAGWPIGAAVLWACLQLAAGWTVYQQPTWRFVLDWGGYFVLFLVALHVLASPVTAAFFRRGLLTAGFGIAVLSTLQYFTSDGAIYWVFPTRSGRPFGPFVNPDHYAAFIELILPLALFEAVASRRHTWLYAAMAGVFYASVVASASRAGLLLVTIELLVIPLIAFRAARPGTSRKVLAGAAAMTLICGGVATAVVGWDPLLRRLHDQDPFRYRRELFVSTLQMIRERPWTGFGMGTFETVYPGYAGFDTGERIDHAHNDWAEWTAEGGLPLLAILVIPVIFTLPRALRHPWALGAHVVLLHSLVDFPLHIPALASLVIVLLSALCAAAVGRPSPDTITVYAKRNVRPLRHDRGILQGQAAHGSSPQDG